MFCVIEDKFSSFLLQHFDGRPWLLALSGGPDSMILFRLLQQFAVPYEVAHVDHGWREESRKEASILQDLCEREGIKFHLCTLQLHGKNLEERGRKARLNFFKSLLTPEFQGVVMGHHQDDLAENVLKRFLEGARITKLAGMRPVSQVYGMTILRPLLGVSKHMILDWLSSQGVQFFRDASNEDLRFLRNRLRLEAIPTLSRLLGKNVKPNLIKMAQLSWELEDYLRERMPHVRAKFQEKHQLEFDFSHPRPTSLFEWKMVLLELFSSYGLSVSTAAVMQIVSLLNKKNNSKCLVLKGCRVCIKGNVMSLYLDELQSGDRNPH